MSILVIVQKSDFERFKADLLVDLALRASPIIIDTADEIPLELVERYYVTDLILIITAQETIHSLAFDQRIAFAKTTQKPIKFINLDEPLIPLDLPVKPESPDKSDVLYLRFYRESRATVIDLRQLLNIKGDQSTITTAPTDDTATDGPTPAVPPPPAIAPPAPLAPAPASPIAQPIRLSPPAPAPLPQQPPPAEAPPTPNTSGQSPDKPPSSPVTGSGGLLSRLNRISQDNNDKRPLAHAPNRDVMQDKMLDLKLAVQQKMREELLSVRETGDIPDRSQIEELFNTVISEHGIVLPRSEKNRLLETILATEEFSVAAPSQEVFFTAYYPREIQAQRRYGLYVYAHLESALAQISYDIEKFKTELGDQIPVPKTAKKSASLKPDTPIMITPECDENAITFDPPSLTKKWEAEWKRFEFDFKPSADLIGETISGRIMVHIYGVEVATIKFAFEIAAAAHDPSPGQRVAEMLRRVRKENPLASAKFASSPAAALYHRIFVSYSRKDRPVAESYRLAQLAVGNDVFMDTYSIRTGENWQAALAKAIDSADIFQLFWSENAAASPNVRDEWEYALHYKCAESDCATFFRPVYWVDPMPAKPPAELSHLNFRYVPMMTMTSDPQVDPTEAQDGSVI